MVFFTILLILMSAGLYDSHCIVVVSLKVSGEGNEWSNLLLWLRQDSDSGSGVVMFNAPTLLLYSLNSLKSLSLIQNL